MAKRADKDRVITEFCRRYDNGPNRVIQSIGTNEAKGTLRVVVYKPNAVGIKFPKTILGWKLDLVFAENKIRPLSGISDAIKLFGQKYSEKYDLAGYGKTVRDGKECILILLRKPLPEHDPLPKEFEGYEVIVSPEIVGDAYAL